MKKEKRKILFISHDATRTGAPILLLNLFEALKADYEIHFALKHGGILTEVFINKSSTFLIEKKASNSKLARLKNRFTAKKLPFDLTKILWEQYALVISNTITNGDVLPLVKKLYNGPILSYVHELEMATAFFTNKVNLGKLLENSSGFLVPSLAVKNHLIKNLAVFSDNVALLHYFIPAKNDKTRYHQILENELIVGGIGTSDWRKGPDLFIIIAKILFAAHPLANISFLWQGASREGFEIDRLNYDVRKAGLENKVKFLTASSEVDDFYKKLQLLLLTSREDPYPLVILEAASHCIPTICFDNAGGGPEFIASSNGGYVAPYLDLNAVVDKIIYYYNNKGQLKTEGLFVKKQMDYSHHSKSYIKKQFESAIKKLAK